MLIQYEPPEKNGAVIKAEASTLLCISVLGDDVQHHAIGQATAEEIEFLAKYLNALASRLRRSIMH